MDSLKKIEIEEAEIIEIKAFEVLKEFSITTPLITVTFRKGLTFQRVIDMEGDYFSEGLYIVNQSAFETNTEYFKPIY